MANQNIAVKLTLAGQQQVVKGIEQIELALQAARLEQSRFAQGSTEWKQYEIEINNAGKALDRFKARQQGFQSLEKQLGAFVKLGGLLTSTFTTAASAITLFGGDSEKVSKAAAQAQLGLAVAITAVEFAKEDNTIATVKNTVAEIALNAATKTSNTLFKTLFTTIAANPLTSLAIAVGGLITLFYSLADATDEAAESQKEFNDALNADIAKSVTSLNRLTITVNDNNLALDTRKKALEDLKSLAPSYFKNLKDEDILSGRVKLATEQLTTAIIAQAKARALSGRIEENYIRQLDLEEKLAKATKERADAQRAAANVGIVTGGGSVAGVGGQGTAQAAAQQRLIDKTNELKGIQIELQDVKDAIASDERLITTINRETDATIGATAATTDNKDALEAAKKAQEAFEAALRATLDTQAELNQLTLESATFFQAEESSVLEYIDKLLERQNEIISRRRELLKSEQQKLSEEIRQIFLEIFPATDELLKVYDQYGNIVKNFDLVLLKSVAGFAKVPIDLQDAISKGLTFDGIVQSLLDNATDEARVFFRFLQDRSKELTEGQKADITRYFNTIISQAQNFSNGLSEGLFNVNMSVEDSLLLLNKLGSSYQTLSNEVEAGTKTQQQADQILKTQIEESLALLGLQRKETAGLQGSQFILATEYNKELEKQVGLLLELTKNGQDYRQGIIDTSEQIKKQIELLITQRKELGQPLSEEQLEGFKQFFKQRAQQFPTLIKEFLLNPDAFKSLGQGAIDAALEGINEGLQDFEPKTRTEVEKLIAYLEIVGQEIANTFGFDENPFFDKINKLKEKLKELPTEAELQFQKSIKNIQQFIADLQIALNSIQQAANAYYNFQFDQLEKRNKRIQDTIVGTSEAANKKRLEADKAYQAERERLEKKQAKLSLRIALVQSIANTAEAVTRSLGNPILAAIVGAAGVVQTGIIIEQLNAIDTYRRGGRLKKMQTGGFLQGPSHEYGGVKFQNGGIELEGGEAIINRQSTIQYASLLSSINMAGGGKPIVMNNFDDSRLIEAIAKQRNMPLRAYVVEQDITNSQTVQRRLEQLAQI